MKRHCDAMKVQYFRTYVICQKHSASLYARTIYRTEMFAGNRIVENFSQNERFLRLQVFVSDNTHLHNILIIPELTLEFAMFLHFLTVYDDT